LTRPARLELLAVCGSLRAASSNRTLLQAAAALAPVGVEVLLSEHLVTLPQFNPDHDGADAPGPVLSWRQAVERAGGLLLSVPEYAHGLPGAFKNGLDWLVSDPAMLAKPIAIWNASARGTYAHASLVEILRTMSTTIVEEAGVTLPILDGPVTVTTLLENTEIRGMLRGALDALVRAIETRAGAIPPE
jgi:chromate reductase, NAD(P)H dehydrogenase (quinone)